MTSALESQTQAAEREWLEHWKRGPTRLRWLEVPVQVGDPAPDVPLQDATGNTVRLSDSWVERPALLLFWRHYGCGCGIERAKRLQAEHGPYVSAGANVVCIGQGEPERAAAYAERYGLPCPVLCDPELSAYLLYGLLEGKPTQIAYGQGALEFVRLDDQARVTYAKQRREAGRPPVDNPFQLPGEFVIDRTGMIRLAYRYQYCDNYPDPEVLITSIREAAATDTSRRHWGVDP